jgi:hypothetical protein
MNVWRDGNCIVIHRFGQFPDRCILSNDYSAHRIKQWVSCSALPEWAQILLKTLKIIPVLGLIFALIFWLLQHRLSVTIPLSQTEYARYQRRRWAIVKGACCAEAIGWMLAPLADREATQFIGILGLAAIVATPVLAGLLWFDRNQLIVLEKMQNDYLWLIVCGNNHTFANSLPAWEAQLLD